MHNFSTVYRFEVVRTLKKKSFWIVSLIFPLMVVVIVGIVYASNQATNKAAEQSAKQHISFGVTDQSHLVSPRLLAAYHAKTFTSKSAGIDAVKNGKLDAYFFYPPNIIAHPVAVYGKDIGVFNDSRYASFATSLLKISATASVKPAVVTILEGGVTTSTTTYKNGTVYNGMDEMIVPGVFLVLFYLLIATFGNQMLSSTTEEKENRVVEMILTTIEARTLIIGKIFSLITLGFLQMCIVLVPVLIAYFFLHDKLSLPSIDLAHLVFNWPRIGIGFAIFALGYIMFTGLLVTISAAVPTAKEAGPFFGVVMMLLFGPLYAAPLFVSSPHTGIVEALSFIPLTAPIPLLLRNAVGNLSGGEAIIAIIILAVSGIVLMSLAVRAFKSGALEYSRKLSLREILALK